MASEQPPATKFKCCRSCGESKPATTDYFNKKLDRLVSRCRDCRNAERRAELIATDPDEREAANALRRQARKRDPERFRLQDQRKYQKHRVKALEKGREYRDRNRERIRQRCLDYYYRNREARIRSVVERTRRKAPHLTADEIEAKRRYLREWRSKRYRSVPSVRVHTAFSATINSALRRKSGSKNGKGGRSWVDLVGYDLTTLMSHIERQFSRGMSWANYGEWHIDHILPVASFAFSSADDDQFRACWALSNLRPLWAKDNLTKKDKRLLLI